MTALDANCFGGMSGDDFERACKFVGGAFSASVLIKATGVIDWLDEMRNLHELKLKTQK